MTTKPDATNVHAYSEVELDRYLKRLIKATEKESEDHVAAAYKTVDTFSGLIGRKMWLKNSREGAYTDGWEIGAPFQHSHFYQLVEHEISHNLFQSNFKAKESFSKEYAAQIVKAVESRGKSVSAQDKFSLENCLGTLVNVLEDHRVNSLWAMLYPGSYSILQDYSRDLLSKRETLLTAHESIITYFLLTAYDVPNVPPGRLDRLKPAFVAALKKVERKGPGATFVLCKWLVTQLVSELIRTLKGEPPPPDAGSARIAVDLPADGSAAAQGSSAGDSSDSGDDANDGEASGGNAEPKAQGAKAAKDGSDWEPPTVNASAEQRVQALQDFIGMSGSPSGGQTDGQVRAQAMLADVRAGRFDRKDESSYVKDLVAGALNTDVNDSISLDLQLGRSEKSMEKVIDSIEAALQQQRKRDENEWITRDAHAKVVFKDVKSSSHEPSPLSAEDRQTVARLKDFFGRIKLRRKNALSDSGAEVDVEAYVASKVGRTIEPVFKQESSGRGFKMLLLLDRSSSMQGFPSMQVERAARVLRAALKQPNVQVHVWGFQSSGNEVKLTRIAPNIDVQDSIEMPVKGETPLHVAVRTAVNWMEAGSERKHLMVLTDGKPVFSTADGRSYGENQLLAMVDKECSRARKQNIGVSAIGIGNGVDDDSMLKMFGDRRHWLRVQQTSTLGKQVVSAVTRAFTHYLKNG